MEGSLAHGCYKFLKLSLFIFNLIFWIIGIAILIVGIALRVGSNRATIFNDVPFLHTGAYLLIFIGLVMTITGFLGCCGALRESQCMLFSFFLILAFIFIILIAAGIWAIASHQKLKNEMREVLISYVESYGKEDEEVNKKVKTMNFIQKHFKCCGVTSSSDYGVRGTKTPDSCGGSVQEKIKKKGCYDALIQEGQNNLITVGGVGIGMALIMIVGMTFSIIVCCAIRDGVR